MRWLSGRMRIALGLAISGALLVLAVRNAELADVVQHLGRTRLDALVLAMALGIPLLGARGIRWRYFFHPERPGAGGLTSATMIGYMWNAFLPLRAGELVRVYLAARRERLPFLTVMATLALERMLDGLVILGLLGAVLAVVPLPLAVRQGALVLLVLNVAGVAAVFTLSRRPQLAAACLRRLPARAAVGSVLEGWIAQFADGVRCLVAGPHVPPLAAWTVVIWGLNVLTVWLTMAAAHLDVPPAAALLVLVCAGLGMAVPSGPGYVGTLEFFVVLPLALYGVSESAALSFAVLLRAAAFVPIIAAGGFLVLRHQVSMSGVTRAARAAAGAASASR